MNFDSLQEFVEGGFSCQNSFIDMIRRMPCSSVQKTQCPVAYSTCQLQLVRIASCKTPILCTLLSCRYFNIVFVSIISQTQFQPDFMTFATILYSALWPLQSHIFSPLAFSLGSSKSVTQGDTRINPRTECFSAYLEIYNN